MPLAAIEIELHDLEQVAAGHSQAATRLWRIHRRVDPGYVPNAKRIEQSCLRESVCASSRALLNDLAQHKDTAGAIAERTPKWRGCKLVTQVRTAANR